eukprot:jgi/Botrbrau1/5395/Bobra.0346s0055.1
MSYAQLAVVILAETVPNLVMLLPAVHGAFTASFSLYFGHMSDLGLALPEFAAPLTAALVTASLCAGVGMIEARPAADELEAVLTATQNADRYYRLLGLTNEGVSPEAQSQAFKSVAQAWFRRKMALQRYIAVSYFLDFLFLALLFHTTGDFAAPMVAGVFINAVDFGCVSHRLAHEGR